MATLLRRRKLGLTSCREISGMSQQGVGFIRNDKPWPVGEDVCIRWGTTSNIPNGVRVVNSAAGIHRVADKRGFRKMLSDAGLCQKTHLEFETAWHDVPDVTWPVVIRKKTHAQGRGLWVASNYQELSRICQPLGQGNYYFSQLIPKVAEYRVLVAQGRVVWVAQKTPGNPDDVAWNVNQGGRFDNVRWDGWPPAVIENALASWELSKLHFGGVDVMVDAEGKAYCLEINSAPSQTSPYRQSCMAKTFDWMLLNDKLNRREFEPTQHRTWKDSIHPALWEKGRNRSEANAEQESIE